MMKMLPILLLGMALIVGCGDGLDDPKILNKIIEEALEGDKFQYRGPKGEELKYALNSREPYTGWMKVMYDDGQIKALYHNKDGKLGGHVTRYHENGQKQSETRYKDGKTEGLFTLYHENGQKLSEGHYKDGKKDGPWTFWDKDGNELGVD